MSPKAKSKQKTVSARNAPIADVSTTPLDKEGRKKRADGVEARERLLLIALRLFAEKGYAKTSTREIAQAAGANIAAISYYFGDKAGLYRAVFTEPMGGPDKDIPLYDQPHFTLRQSLEGFFTSFVEPMKQGDLVRLCTRLHFRELLEPTGVWEQEINNSIKPAHIALVGVLSRHLGRGKPDDDVHRLAFSIVGLALQMFICRDVIEAIRPSLIDSPTAVDRWTMRLIDFAEAMVAVEVGDRSASIRKPAVSSMPVKKKTR